MNLIALGDGSQGMPLSTKHPVALFKYSLLCSLCEKTQEIHEGHPHL